MFQDPVKTDISNKMLLLLKVCNACYECKNNIFMNTDHMNIM